MKHKIINNEIYTKQLLFKFSIFHDDFNMEAPDVISEWKQSTNGKWCLDRAKEISFITEVEAMTLHRQGLVVGYLRGKDSTWLALND